MSKVFRVMMAAGVVAVMLMALSGAFVWAASYPYPTYGTATVDGVYGEWNLAEDGTGDFFANMYEAADPTKDVMSKLYLRYDCSTNTLYALVLVEPGHTIDVDADPTPGEEHFIKINGSKIVSDADRPPAGGPPDFEWIGLSVDGTTADGWEASASLDPGTYNDFDVHTQVDNNQTSAVKDRQLELVIDCPPECDVAYAGSLDYEDNKVKWDIINNSTYYDLVIQSIEDLQWPVDNGHLTEVSLGEKLIWTGSESEPPPLTINSGWEGTPEDRTIEAGNNTETLELTFENPAKANPTNIDPYYILVRFDSPPGCVVLISAGEPTVVTLSSFAAKSSVGSSASWLWLGLVGTVLAAGSVFWAKRRAG